MCPLHLSRLEQDLRVFVCPTYTTGSRCSISSLYKNVDQLLNPLITDQCFMSSPLLSSSSHLVLIFSFSHKLFFPASFHCHVSSLIPHCFCFFSKPSSSYHPRLPASWLHCLSLKSFFIVFPNDWLTDSSSLILSLWMIHYCLCTIYTSPIQRNTFIVNKQQCHGWVAAWVKGELDMHL